VLSVLRILLVLSGNLNPSDFLFRNERPINLIFAEDREI